jgi:hypothetical protein
VNLILVHLTRRNVTVQGPGFPDRTLPTMPSVPIVKSSIKKTEQRRLRAEVAIVRWHPGVWRTDTLATRRTPHGRTSGPSSARAVWTVAGAEPPRETALPARAEAKLRRHVSRSQPGVIPQRCLTEVGVVARPVSIYWPIESAEITGPSGTQLVPSKRAICIWLKGE